MPSNNPSVCVPCRYVARQTWPCPHCGGPMVEKHYSWRAPRRTNDAAWKRIERGDWLWDRSASRTDMRTRSKTLFPQVLERWPHRWTSYRTKRRQGGRILSDRLP